MPSGTKWSSQNVGARKPSEAGLYFQWGDTVGYTADQVGTGEGQKKFASDWSDYKWRLSGDSDSNVAFTKYTTPGATLELEDDAAHAHMGDEWHMPTPTQIQELIDNTTSAWTASDGISGTTFTSKKDTSMSIFIPAAGYAYDGLVGVVGSEGDVFSSMLYTDDARYVQGLRFYFYKFPVSSSNSYIAHQKSYLGYSVRGVIDG